MEVAVTIPEKSILSEFYIYIYTINYNVKEIF